MSLVRRGSRTARAAALALAILAALAGTAGAQERFRRTAPLPEAQRMELKLPPVETFTLPNGLVVASVRRTEAPPEASMTTLQLIIRAGEADSPVERPGLATMTGLMIGKGTKMLSADYLENLVESVGGTFSTAVFMDYTVLTLKVLNEYVDRGMFIFRLMALEATFSERELAAVRRTSFWRLYESKKDPEVLGWRQLLRSLFETYPYRRAAFNEDVIKYITTRDVADFYSRYYRPGNAAVVISGNIDGPTAAQRIGGHFGAWTGSAPARPATPLPPPQNDRGRVCFVGSPGAGAAAVFAGNVIMGSSGSDFFPFLVLKHILGGTTQSRLFMNLREAKAYATFAFSEMETFSSSGLYWVRAQVKPDSIVPAVREILGEIGGLAVGPAVPSEIEEAKSYLVGSLPLRFESRSGFDDWLARYVALGLDPSQWDRGPEELKRVDAERVREVARKYLSARPVVVVVGRPEWLGTYLGDLDTVEVYDSGGQLKHIRRKGEEGR